MTMTATTPVQRFIAGILAAISGALAMGVILPDEGFAVLAFFAAFFAGCCTASSFGQIGADGFLKAIFGTVLAILLGCLFAATFLSLLAGSLVAIPFFAFFAILIVAIGLVETGSIFILLVAAIITHLILRDLRWHRA
ncbi:MAG: hypothetical protein ACRC6I_10280 [Paracoccaceae bacterium]